MQLQSVYYALGYQITSLDNMGKKFRTYNYILTGMLFVMLTQLLFSQNLVSNYNFENYKKRPTGHDQLNLLYDWYCPNPTTPDFFVVSVSKGNSNPLANNQDTNGYVGLVFRPAFKYGLHFSYCDYYEYIAIKLKNRLTKGKKYIIKCDVFFSAESVYCLNNIGAAFSRDSIFFSEKRVLPIENIPLHNSGSPLDKEEWITVCNTYESKGKEKFIALGSFSGKDDLSLIKNSNLNFNEFKYKKESDQRVYMYIDNVIVEELNDKNRCTKTNFVIDNLEIGKSYKIDNINFKFEEAKLLTSSFPTLEQLVSILKSNPKLKIQINGYTDNSGNPSYNLKLSEQRAEAVYNFLIQKGIPSIRLKFEGLGGKNPIASNNTQRGRALNRRVEFLVMDK